MKKIFTLIAAALMAVGVNAQEQLTLKGGWNTTTLPTKGMIFTVSSWAEIGFELDEAFAVGDYAKVGIVTTTGTAEGFQWKIYKAEGGEAYSDVCGADVTSFTFDVSGISSKKVALMRDGNNYSAGDIQVDHFYLEKADGSQVEYLAKAISDWGVSASYPAGAMPSIQFDGRYGGVEVLDATGASIVYEPGTNAKAYKYTIEFEEPLANSLMVEYQNGGNGFKWLNFAAGADKVEFVVDDENCVKNTGTDDEPVMTPTKVEQIWIKADASSGYPFVMKVKSMTRAENTPDAIKAVKAERNDGVRYNLAGQKVGESYKGIVIVNGKKMIQK